MHARCLSSTCSWRSPWPPRPLWTCPLRPAKTLLRLRLRKCDRRRGSWRSRAWQGKGGKMVVDNFASSPTSEPSRLQSLVGIWGLQFCSVVRKGRRHCFGYICIGCLYFFLPLYTFTKLYTFVSALDLDICIGCTRYNSTFVSAYPISARGAKNKNPPISFNWLIMAPCNICFQKPID